MVAAAMAMMESISSDGSLAIAATAAAMTDSVSGEIEESEVGWGTMIV